MTNGPSCPAPRGTWANPTGRFHRHLGAVGRPVGSPLRRYGPRLWAERDHGSPCPSRPAPPRSGDRLNARPGALPPPPPLRARVSGRTIVAGRSPPCWARPHEDGRRARNESASGAPKTRRTREIESAWAGQRAAATGKAFAMKSRRPSPADRDPAPDMAPGTAPRPPRPGHDPGRRRPPNDPGGAGDAPAQAQGDLPGRGIQTSGARRRGPEPDYIRTSTAIDTTAGAGRTGLAIGAGCGSSAPDSTRAKPRTIAASPAT